MTKKIFKSILLVAGAVLHYLIERPFLRWRGRLPFTARKQVASPAAE